MRYGYSDYPRDGMDFDQIEAWVIEASSLNAISLLELSNTECAETAAQIRAHVLTLFRNEGTEFRVHGITKLRPEYGDHEEANAHNWQLLQDSYFDSNLRVDTDEAGELPQQNLYDCILTATALGRMSLVREHVALAQAEIGQTFEEDKVTYGNKFANLRATESVVKHLDELLGTEAYVVPPFSGIPTALHTTYREGSLTSQDLQPYYHAIRDIAAGEGYWVRSSATESEDSEETSAAGIYESVFVPGDASMDDFETAVRKVYGSVDSEEAIRYRAEHGIETESMGIVLQVNSSIDEGDWGYSNSVVPGIGALQEVYISDKPDELISKTAMVRMPFWRDRTLMELTCRPHRLHGMVWWDDQASYSQASYFAYDERRMYPEAYLKASYLSRFSELVYGRPVQQEFISSRHDFEVVQTRPLPSGFTEVSETFTGFPDEPYLFSGRALGIANGISGKPLSIDHIEVARRHADENYIIVSEDNFGASSTSPYLLKHAKAVVVISDAIGKQLGARGAHLETLCAEMGIPCSFATKTDPEGEEEASHRVYSRLLGRSTLTLYLDGLTSRVY